jgi:hypothetical protein
VRASSKTGGARPGRSAGAAIACQLTRRNGIDFSATRWDCDVGQLEESLKKIPAQPPLTGVILDGQPLTADQRDEHVARVYRAVDHVVEIQARLDLADVSEDVVQLYGVSAEVTTTRP